MDRQERLSYLSMRGKIFAGVAAVISSAVLTLATMVALVQGSILAVSISNLALRIVAVAADIVLGTILLVGCIYFATHLAVRILGVGNADFPPLPDDTGQGQVPKN